MKTSIAPVLLLAPVLSLTLLGACETELSYANRQAAERAAPRPEPVLVVRHHVGGTHYRTLVIGDLAYVTFGASLIVVATDTGNALASVELMPFGTSGAATQLIAFGGPEGVDRLFALLDGTAVCEISLEDPKKPVVTSIRRRAEIGFAPRALSWSGGSLWIGGDGGVVHWEEVAPPPDPDLDAKTRAKLAEEHPPPPVRLATTARERGGLGEVVATDAGLVVTSGRRVLRLDDGSFVGAATWLGALSVEETSRLGVPGAMLFILQGAEGAEVGLMGPDVRELCSRALPGQVRRVRLLGSELVVLNDEEMQFYKIQRGSDGLTLADPTIFRVKGARDIDAIDENYYYVVGSFGRAVWRRLQDRQGRGDEFYAVRREPSALVNATGDRRRVLASGPQGSWLYTVGDSVDPDPRRVDTGDDGRKPTVSSSWGKATIAEDKHSVTIVPAGPASNPKDELTWQAPLGGELFGVESIAGRLWVWHQHGVDVLTIDGGKIRSDASVRLDGPVHYLFPQRVGNAAAYVSEYGGMGLLAFVDRSVLPTTSGERVTDRNGDGEPDVELTKDEVRK